MASKGLLVLGLLGLGGGAYYLATRKPACPAGQHRMPDGTCMADALMPGLPGQGPESAQDVLDPEMVALYQTIIYGHGTPGDCQTLLEYIDHLSPENAAEEQWIADRRSEVVQACEAGPIDVNASPGFYPSSYSPGIPPLPWDLIPENVRAGIEACFNGTCDPGFAYATAQNLMSLASYYHGVIPGEDERQLRFAADTLGRNYGFATAGTPHVGDCGCASCAAKREEVGHEDHDKPCCEACAQKGVGACSCQQAIDTRLEDERYKVAGRV